VPSQSTLLILDLFFFFAIQILHSILFVSSSIRVLFVFLSSS